MSGAGVFNLSSAVLTDEEKHVLDKGLKYVPPRTLNKFSTFIDVQKFVRKLSIQRHFLAPPLNIVPTVSKPLDTHVHSGLANPSLFNPSGNMAPAINVFRSLVLQDLDVLPNKRIHVDPRVKTGLKQLCDQKDLIIRPADKGGAINRQNRLRQRNG